MTGYIAAWRATKGARKYQEDTAALWPQSARDLVPAPTLLAVLADGMGGHAGGALASRLVCETFLASFAATHATEPDGAATDALRDALNSANAAIEKAITENPVLSGMGSTLVGAAFGVQGLDWVSVGDSPLYLFRGGEIALLNEDHSLAPALDRMAADGRLTLEEARNDPRRHLLRSAVTGEELDLVDLSRRTLVIEPGDVFVLASDGIHALESSEIARLAAAYAPDGPLALADALLRAVDELRDPHQDNTTVVIVTPT